MQLKPKSWNCLRFTDRSMVVNEAVSDVMRRPCLCGDGVWWRVRANHPWSCRTCDPPNANAKAFWIRRKRNVVDPTEHEIAAIQAASEPAGEYLESIGKTDLAALEEDEWMTLLDVICTAYSDKLAELGG